jgi:hypothetical protein
MLFALLACLVVSSPALAAPNWGTILDPIIIPPGFFLADPCFGASFSANMGTADNFDSTFDTDFLTAVYRYTLSVSGTVVGTVYTTYKRVGTGAATYMVTMDDTIVGADGTTVFGRSVNRGVTGIIGLKGEIVGAINPNGTINHGINGRYLTSNFTGTNKFCAFLE